MAETVEHHIKRALQLIGATSPIRPAPAETIQTALSVYNDMIARWFSEGIDVGAAQTETVGDDAQNDQWASPAIQYSLAIEVAPLLQIEASPGVIARASTLFVEMRSRVRLKEVDPSRVEPDGRLPYGSGNTRGRRYGRRFYGGNG